MIEIMNLHHRYPDGTYAIKGIDLTIPEGEFLLVCGLNGSGKTTLIRIISGLLSPTAGTVRVKGIDVAHTPKEVRRLVGMVFQDADSQIIGETVREDVAFGPENLGLSPEEIDRRVDVSLHLMGLEGVAEKPCYLLSGGEKRRLSIAGVLAMKPQILLFDEPFTHLDYRGTREVLRHMVHLHREKHTLILATHEVENKATGSPEKLVEELSYFEICPPYPGPLENEKIPWPQK
jgi:biotin transport system ATP-binding protein